MSKSTRSRFRIVVIFSIVAGAIVLSFLEFGRETRAGSWNLLAASVTSTKTAALAPGGDATSNGLVNPGDTIRYTVTINNGAAPGAGNDAANTIFTDTLNSNLTLMAGSLHASPIAANDAYETVGNTLLEVGVAQGAAPSVNVPGGVLGNDIAPPTTPDTFSIQSSQTTSANGGTVSVNSNGTFTYLPAAGFSGTDTFTYTLKNDAVPSLTSVGTVTVTVSAPKVWYVNAAAPAGGDGRSTSPFSSLTPVNGAGGAGDVDGAGDVIYLYTGTYSTGIILENTQQLIGNGVALTVTIGGNPVTLRAAGVRPTITSAGAGVTLATNNTLAGFNIGNTGTTDITGSAFGTLTASQIDITGTGRTLDLQTGTLAATFDSLTSTSAAGGAGLNLSAVTGSLSVTGTTSITGAGGAGISISGSSATIGLGTATTVATPTLQGILIGTTTGNVSFGNTTVTGGSDGVSFQNNSAGTRTFGTLNVSGGTGSAFLSGAGGGNVSVTGAAVLTSAANPVDIQNAGAAVINFAGGAAVTKTTTGGFGVNLVASSVTFESLGITSSNGGGLSATTSGTVTVTNGSKAISATGGAAQAAPAIIANGVTLNANFSAVSSTNSGNGVAGLGVSLTTVAGTSNFGTGSISGSTAAAFLINGGAASVTYNGTITQANAARLIDIQNKTGGTLNFGGAISTPNTSSTGILLNNNSSTTTNFTGGLTLTTGANAALTATNSGTLTATQNNTTIVNSITTTTGDGLKVVSTTIGAAGLTFRSISSTGGTGNGITLDTTGAGAFALTGNGGTCTTATPTCTGGSIQTKSGADGSSNTQGSGIYMNAVSGAVSLTNIKIDGCTNYGIRGIGVSGGLTLDNSLIGATTKNGSSATVDTDADTAVSGEGSVRFLNLTGTVAFTNDTFDNGFGRTIFLHNNTNASTLNLTVSNSTLRESLNNSNGGDPAGGSTDAMFMQANNSATMNLTMSNTQITAYRQFGILTDARDAATMNIDIGSSNFSNSNTGNANASASLNFGGSGGSVNDVFVHYNVHNNTFRHGSGGVTPTNGGAQIVSGGVSGGVKMDGKVLNNTFGVTGVPFSGAGNGADALRLFASGNNAASTRISGSTHTRYLVQGNTIQRYGEAGIQFNARQGNSIMDATVLGNIIREPGTAAAGAFAGIWVNAGAVNPDTNVVNIAIGSATNAADKNTMTDSDPNNATDVFLDSNTCAGCNSQINVYQNGSDAAGATIEARVRDILVDDNNPTLDLVGGFTNGSIHMAVVAGTPPQPTIVPPALEGSVAQMESEPAFTDAARALGEMAFVEAGAVQEADLGGIASLEGETVAGSDSPSTFGVLSEIAHKAVSELSPTVYAQEVVGGNAIPEAGETITVNGGSAAGFTIPAGKTVTIVFDAQVAPVGTIAANVFSVSNQGSTSGTGFGPVLTDDPSVAGAANPTVTTIVQPETISKAFNPTAPLFGQQSTLTFTITNANPATAATGITFTDVFPTTPGAMVVGAPLTTTNTCGGTLQNNSGGVLAAGDPGIKLVGGALAANGGSCTVSVKVATPVPGTYTNTSGNISSVEGAVGLTSNPAQLNVNVLTAGGVTVSGRVLSADGRGIRGARVTITDSEGQARSVATGERGRYQFDDVEAGRTYTVTVVSRRFSFSPKVISVTDQLSDLDFTSEGTLIR